MYDATSPADLVSLFYSTLVSFIAVNNRDGSSHYNSCASIYNDKFMSAKNKSQDSKVCSIAKNSFGKYICSNFITFL